MIVAGISKHHYHHDYFQVHASFVLLLVAQMSQHLLSYGDCLLDPEDLKLLEHNEWLNDKVIDFAFE